MGEISGGGVDCDGDERGRTNPESLQGSAVRKGKWCQRKGYRVPRGRRDQESARAEEGKPARRLSQELRVSDLSQVTFLSDFRIYAVLGFSIFEPSLVKVRTVIAILSHTSFHQQLLLCKYFRELRRPTLPQKRKKEKKH